MGGEGVELKNGERNSNTEVVITPSQSTVSGNFEEGDFVSTISNNVNPEEDFVSTQTSFVQPEGEQKEIEELYSQLPKEEDFLIKEENIKKEPKNRQPKRAGGTLYNRFTRTVVSFGMALGLLSGNAGFAKANVIDRESNDPNKVDVDPNLSKDKKDNGDDGEEGDPIIMTNFSYMFNIPDQSLLNYAPENGHGYSYPYGAPEGTILKAERVDGDDEENKKPIMFVVSYENGPFSEVSEEEKIGEGRDFFETHLIDGKLSLRNWAKDSDNFLSRMSNGLKQELARSGDVLAPYLYRLPEELYGKIVKLFASSLNMASAENDYEINKEKGTHFVMPVLISQLEDVREGTSGIFSDVGNNVSLKDFVVGDEESRRDQTIGSPRLGFLLVRLVKMDAPTGYEEYGDSVKWYRMEVLGYLKNYIKDNPSKDKEGKSHYEMEDGIYIEFNSSDLKPWIESMNK